MSTVNKVILIGNLGDEVKMHHFEGGNCIGRFPIATSDSYNNKQTGQKVTTTEWHNIVVRNKQAEVCEKYLKKGSKVYVEGKLKTRQWEQDGQKRYSTEIHANVITFLSSQQQTNTGHQSAPAPDSGVSDAEPDDLPF